MVSFNSLKVNDTIYEIYSTKMGNVNASTKRVATIHILEIDQDNRKARVTWNGRESWKNESWFKRSSIRRNKPELRETFTGAYVVVSSKKK